MVDSTPLNSAGRKRSRGMRWILAGAVLAVSAAAAMTAAQGHGAMGMGGPVMIFGGSPEHIARAVDHMLDGLAASDAQRAQIKQIATAAAADLKPQRDAGRALRERGMQLLAAPNVDANAAESLRQQMLVQHDQASRRILAAMLDVSRVLTPEQKAKIAERMRQHDEKMQERSQRLQHEHPAAQ